MIDIEATCPVCNNALSSHEEGDHPPYQDHADHDEPVKSCWDCQEQVAATWHDVMAGF